MNSLMNDHRLSGGNLLTSNEIGALADLVTALEHGPLIAVLLAKLQSAIEERHQLAEESIRRMQGDSSNWIGSRVSRKS